DSSCATRPESASRNLLGDGQLRYSGTDVLDRVDVWAKKHPESSRDSSTIDPGHKIKSSTEWQPTGSGLGIRSSCIPTGNRRCLRWGYRASCRPHNCFSAAEFSCDHSFNRKCPGGHHYCGWERPLHETNGGICRLCRGRP